MHQGRHRWRLHCIEIEAGGCVCRGRLQQRRRPRAQGRGAAVLRQHEAAVVRLPRAGDQRLCGRLRQQRRADSQERLGLQLRPHRQARPCVR